MMNERAPIKNNLKDGLKLAAALILGLMTAEAVMDDYIAPEMTSAVEAMVNIPGWVVDGVVELVD